MNKSSLCLLLTFEAQKGSDGDKEHHQEEEWCEKKDRRRRRRRGRR